MPEQPDRRVWKYPMTEFTKTFTMPYYAKPVHFGMQGNLPTLWCEVDLRFRVEDERTFRIFGTGHAIPPKAEYVGTVQSGTFVWHLYELNVYQEAD